MERPLGIAAISVINVIVGISVIVDSIDLDLNQLTVRMYAPFLLGNIFVPLAYIASAIGLWNRKKWGWLLASILAVYSVVASFVRLMLLSIQLSPLHVIPELWKLAFPIAIAAYLFRERLITAFGWNALIVKSPRRKVILAALVLSGVQILFMMIIIGAANESL